MLEVVITAIVSVLGGGGAVVWYKEFNERANSKDDHSLNVANSEREFIRMLNSRLETVEAKLETQQKQMMKIQRDKSSLVADVRVLVERVRVLLSRLSSYEEIPEEERKRWSQTSWQTRDTQKPSESSVPGSGN